MTNPQDAEVQELLNQDFLLTSPEKQSSDGFFAAILQCSG
jgi:hypothetical protein